MKACTKFFSCLIGLSLVVTAVSAWESNPGPKTTFDSSDGRYKLGRSMGKWVVSDVATGDKLYSLDAEFRSRTFFIEDNGRSVIEVMDNRGTWSPFLPALVFYREGVETSSYLLSELLPEHIPVASTLEPLQWLVEEPKVQGSMVSLKTLDLVTHHFDLQTGAQLSRELDSRLLNGELYLTGRVTQLGRDRYLIRCECPLSAQIETGTEIEFTWPRSRKDRSILEGRSDRRLESGDYSMIVREGECVAFDRSRYFDSCRLRVQPDRILRYLLAPSSRLVTQI